MSSVAIHNNLSSVIDAIIAEDSQAITRAANEMITRAEDASELLGQVGLVAMHGDNDGHTILTLGAAIALSRWLIALRHVLGEDTEGTTRAIPLVVQALIAATPAVKAGKDAPYNYPEPLFPSGLSEKGTVAEALHQAIEAGDATQVERLLFGLYGTGADYRTTSIRIYDGISQIFQEDGHALQFAARGAHVLDAVEWSEASPNYIHWLAPHLPQHQEEPGWTQVVRDFLSESQHSLQSYRTRIAAPKNENALPLRALLLSNASTPKVLQGVYDALIKNGASARAVGSVIALAATDLLQNVSTDNQDLFVHVAHGLLFASATRLTYTQVQAVEGLPLLFTAAAYINSLGQELSASDKTGEVARPGKVGGGLIAPALLESLSQQIDNQDLAGALATSRRYIQLGHDAYALFAVIGLNAAKVDASADQGHTLQIVQAAGDEFLSWPEELSQTSIDGFLQVALRAVALGRRSTPGNL